MGLINRFWVAVHSLCVGILSLLAAGLLLDVVPAGLRDEALRYATARPETLAALAALFLLSMHLLAAALFSRQKPAAPDGILLVEAAEGAVRVSTEAVRNLAARAACTVRGVRDAKAQVRPGGKGHPLGISMQMVVLQGMSAPEIGQQAAQEIRRELAGSLGISEATVDISVSEITNAPVEKRQRVV